MRQQQLLKQQFTAKDRQSVIRWGMINGRDEIITSYIVYFAYYVAPQNDFDGRH